MTLKTLPSKEFLQPKTRTEYLVDEEMKRAWAVQIDLLMELIRVCQKHNLRIFAEGGTLLGTIRHGGYIPWDDDIDTAMFREDYDKLIEVAPQEFSHPYFFQTVYTDRRYARRHAQLRNSETSCRNVHARKKKHNHGIFIDIFVLDYVPGNSKALAKHVAREKKAKLKLKIVSKIIHSFPDTLYSFCRNNTRWLSDKATFAKYETILRSIPKEKTALVTNISFRPKETIRLKAFYDEVEWMDFEYIKIPVPAGYHQILTMQYGDYMMPKKLITNHGEMHFDTERIDFQ